MPLILLWFEISSTACRWCITCDDRRCQEEVIYNQKWHFVWVNTQGIDIQPRVKGQNGGPLRLVFSGVAEHVINCTGLQNVVA